MESDFFFGRDTLVQVRDALGKWSVARVLGVNREIMSVSIDYQRPGIVNETIPLNCGFLRPEKFVVCDFPPLSLLLASKITRLSFLAIQACGGSKSNTEPIWLSSASVTLAENCEIEFLWKASHTTELFTKVSKSLDTELEFLPSCLIELILRYLVHCKRALYEKHFYIWRINQQWYLRKQSRVKAQAYRDQSSEILHFFYF